MHFRTNSTGLSACRLYLLAAGAWVALLAIADSVRAQERALGLDISAWQGNISQTTWNNIRNIENRQFVFLRSSRGGTTGYYDQSNADNDPPTNTLSQRYDDPYYIQNINRATTAGMYAGTYHFSRPDVVSTTLNSNGIANTGTDEANHFMQMAGPWMRPGYLLPVHDLEAGDGIRTDNEMAQFAIDFSNRIFNVMGIRPAIYTNGNYSQNILGQASLALRNQVVAGYPALWSARWPNQADPNSIDVQNGNPTIGFANIYGPWDDNGQVHPWAFWQYASTGRLQSFNNGGSNLDFDVAHGGVEFLKDYLVPAIWTNDNSGDWSALANWNSGQTPVLPVPGAGQVAPVGTLTLPTPRLPGAAGSGVTSGQHDTVILDRPNANITVTLSAGAHNIRKLYAREALNITGGSLAINYVPSPDSTPISAQFSAPVSLSGAGSLNVHTLQVDATQTFTLGGGTLTLNTIHLMPHASSPAKIAVTGNAAINNPALNTTANISNGAGAGNSGLIDLAGGTRDISVGNGTASVDLSINVPISNGALTKSGLGTMRLAATNTYTGQTTVNDGILLVTGHNQLGATGVVTGMTVVTPGSGGSGHGGTLQLSNNVNYNLPLTIGGGGVAGVTLPAPGTPGALDNLSGNNTWSGPITLAGIGTGGSDPLINQIGSQAGTLTLSGVIQDASGVNAAWAKTGSGDVVVSGTAPNTYTGLTRLSGGRLIVEKDGALGAAGATDAATGNTFQLPGSASTLAFRGGVNYSTFEVINTGGTGAPGQGQVDNLSGDNTFAGQIAFDGPEVGGARQGTIGVASGSLHVTGGLFARGSDGTPRHIAKLGAGTLILSGDGGTATANPLVAPLAASTFNVNAGTVVTRGPSGTTANLPGVATWNVASGGQLNAAAGLFSTGTVQVAAGGQFSLNGGTADLTTLDLSLGGGFNFADGTLHVDTVQGNLTNAGGTLAPGNSPGSTIVHGSYTQQLGAALDIEIGGTTPGTEHDVLFVNGPAILAGDLNVSLIDQFTAPIGTSSFTLLTAASGITGAFDNVTLPGDDWSLQYVGNSVVLSATIAPPGLAGDYNDDGTVDAIDYVLWRKSLGPGPSTLANDDTPDDVGQDDYDRWRANYGMTLQPGGAALTNSAVPAGVPEPASAALFAIAGVVLHFASRRGASARRRS